MNFKNKKTNLGFTLIELLIVISVIGILSGVVLNAINVQGIRQKSRDSQRVSDLKRIQTALELYFTDKRSYPIPNATAFVSASVNNATTGLGALISPTSYISQLPVDPSQGTDVFAGCADTAYGYSYRATASSYALIARMEIDASITSRCSAVTACTTGATPWCNCGVNTYCYAVQNPF